MKQYSAYPLSLKSMIYLVLIAQLCATTLPYCSWLLDHEKELIEMAEAEDSETEKEDTEDKEEKKYQIDLSYLSELDTNLLSRNTDYNEIESNLIPEITTPPPEQITFS